MCQICRDVMGQAGFTGMQDETQCKASKRTYAAAAASARRGYVLQANSLVPPYDPHFVACTLYVCFAIESPRVNHLSCIFRILLDILSSGSSATSMPVETLLSRGNLVGPTVQPYTCRHA